MCKSKKERQPTSCQKNSFAKIHLVGDLLILIITKDNKTLHYAYAPFFVYIYIYTHINVHVGIDGDVYFLIWKNILKI